MGPFRVHGERHLVVDHAAPFVRPPTDVDEEIGLVVEVLQPEDGRTFVPVERGLVVEGTTPRGPRDAQLHPRVVRPWLNSAIGVPLKHDTRHPELALEADDAQVDDAVGDPCGVFLVPSEIVRPANENG